ncbi:MAG: GNAT family N-acetyltransferase [Thermoleophilaceae bacterium]|nr:GNAT family N-acetyltransferase [Thermoleophilaceae bacterium]
MTKVVTAHTADLGEPTLAAARALLFEAFDDMTEADWEHNLGGIHALAWEDGELIGHASVVQRRLIHQGRALRAGYVEGVGVRADRRRRGHAGRLMEEIERVIRGAYEIGALGATDAAAPLYRAHGWRAWQGRTFALTPRGVVRTEAEDDNVYVLEAGAPLDLSGDITCDWREGDVW